MSSLRSPAALDRALLLWEAKQQSSSTVLAFRRHRYWLSRFLRFLHQRGYLRDDPTRRWLSKDSITKLLGTIRRPSVALPGIGTTFFLVLLLLVSLVRVGSDWVPHAVGKVIDLSLSFGLMGRGSIGGPVLLGLMVGFVGTSILRPDLAVRGAVLERNLSFLGRLGAAAFLLIHATKVDSLGLALIVLAGIFLVGRIASLSIWTLENQGGVRLLSGFLAASCLLVLLPKLAFGSGRATIALVLLFAGLLLFVVEGAANITRVPVMSLLDTSHGLEGADLNAAFTVKPVQTFYAVKLESGWLSHVYALTITLSLLLALDRVRLGRPTLEAVAFAAYGLTILGWTRAHLASVLDLDVWKARLQGSHQLYDPAAGDLERLLRRRRRQGLLMELLSQGSVLGLAYLALGTSTVGSTTIPGAIVATFGLAVAASHGRDFFSSLRAVLTGHAALTGQLHISDSGDDVPADVKERLKRWRATINARYRLLALAFVLVTWVVDVLGAVSLFRSIFRWATHLIQP